MWMALVVSYALQESEMLTLFLCSQLWKRLQGLCCQICLVRTTLSFKSKRHDVNEQLQWRFLDNRGLWEGYLKAMFWLVDLNWLVNIWPQHWRRPARISIRDRQFCIKLALEEYWERGENFTPRRQSATSASHHESRVIHPPRFELKRISTRYFHFGWNRYKSI